MLTSNDSLKLLHIVLNHDFCSLLLSLSLCVGCTAICWAGWQPIVRLLATFVSLLINTPSWISKILLSSLCGTPQKILFWSRKAALAQIISTLNLLSYTAITQWSNCNRFQIEMLFPSLLKSNYASKSVSVQRISVWQLPLLEAIEQLTDFSAHSFCHTKPQAQIAISLESEIKFPKWEVDPPRFSSESSDRRRRACGMLLYPGIRTEIQPANKSDRKTNSSHFAASNWTRFSCRTDLQPAPRRRRRRQTDSGKHRK